MVTAQEELLSLYMQKQVGTMPASPAEGHQAPPCLLPTPQACFGLDHPSRTGCDFSPELHVKLQITFIPFRRLLWLLVSASNSYPCPLCHLSMVSLPLPHLSLSLTPLAAFTPIPHLGDVVQSRLFLAPNLHSAAWRQSRSISPPKPNTPTSHRDACSHLPAPKHDSARYWSPAPLSPRSRAWCGAGRSYHVAYRWGVSGRCYSRWQLVEEERKGRQRKSGRKGRSAWVC